MYQSTTNSIQSSGAKSLQYNRFQNVQEISASSVNNTAASNQNSDLSYNNPSMNMTNSIAYNNNQANSSQMYDELIQSKNADTNILDIATTRIPSHHIQSLAPIPIAAYVTPFANPYEGEVPVVNTKNRPLIRCKDCRSYINCFCKFSYNGKVWTCSLCGKGNRTPDYFYQPLDESGERIDKLEKPEIMKGQYEYVATPEYLSRAPMPATYFVLFDVTKSAIDNGIIRILADTLKNVIQNHLLPSDTRAQIGFLAYDTNLHFFSVENGLSVPKIITIPSTTPFFPLPASKFLINMSENEDAIINLLENLPTMFDTPNQVTFGSNILDAIKVSHQIIKHIGGKLLIFQSCSSITNIPCLIPNLKNNTLHHLIAPTDSTLRNLASEMSHFSLVSMDIFLFSHRCYKNISTLSELSTVSGGNFYYYPNFEYKFHGIQFANELYHNLTRPTGWEGFMRIRSSKGFQLKEVYGNYSFKSTDLVCLPSVSCDKTFTYLFDYEQRKTEQADLFQPNELVLQIGFLYTTSDGERRIRVCTSLFPIVQNVHDVFNHINSQLLACTLAQQGLRQMKTILKIDHGRNYVHEKAKEIINQFKISYEFMSSSQMSLPQSLDQFLLYILGILKHPMFKDVYHSQAPSMDLMNYKRLKFQDRNYFETIYWFCPNVMILTQMIEENYGTYNEDGSFNYPPTSYLSCQTLNTQDVILIENSNIIYLWIGQNSPSEIIYNLLGVENYSQIEDQLSEEEIFNIEGGEQENEIKQRLYNIISVLRSQKLPFISFEYVIEGMVGEGVLKELLIEDATEIYPDYNNFYKSLML